MRAMTLARSGVDRWLGVWFRHSRVILLATQLVKVRDVAEVDLFHLLTLFSIGSFPAIGLRHRGLSFHGMVQDSKNED